MSCVAYFALVGIAYFALSVFYTAMSVLDGQGRPGIVAVAFFVGAWLVAIPSAYVFAFVLHAHLRGLWYGLCCGYGVVTLISSSAAYTSDWPALAQLAHERAEGSNKGERDEERILYPTLESPFLAEESKQDAKQQEKKAVFSPVSSPLNSPRMRSTH